MPCVLVTLIAVRRFHWGMYGSHALCVCMCVVMPRYTTACAKSSVEELAMTVCRRCWSIQQTLNLNTLYISFFLDIRK